MIGGDHYNTNPRFELSDGYREMLNIWLLFRGGGMGGVGHLPEAGGVLNQAAIMIDALKYMNHIYDEMTNDDESSAGTSG